MVNTVAIKLRFYQQVAAERLKIPKLSFRCRSRECSVSFGSE